MRIGEVNKDNYKDYLRLLGVKNTESIEKTIDSISGKNIEEEFDHSFEAMSAYQVKMGYAEDGMIVRPGDEGSWRKIVPVSDDIKQRLIDTVRRQFLTNGNGMSDHHDGNEIGAMMKEYRKNISPDDRLSVTWTLGQIVNQENRRLIDYVKANQPGWDYGKPIDQDVLKAAVSGEHIDTKA